MCAYKLAVFLSLTSILIPPLNCDEELNRHSQAPFVLLDNKTSQIFLIATKTKHYPQNGCFFHQIMLDGSYCTLYTLHLDHSDSNTIIISREKKEKDGNLTKIEEMTFEYSPITRGYAFHNGQQQHSEDDQVISIGDEYLIRNIDGALVVYSPIIAFEGDSAAVLFPTDSGFEMDLRPIWERMSQGIIKALPPNELTLDQFHPAYYPNARDCGDIKSSTLNLILIKKSLKVIMILIAIGVQVLLLLVLHKNTRFCFWRKERNDVYPFTE